jgi:hypothetical protein
VKPTSDADLASRCRAYLQAGPPEHFADYVPDSLTEIIISCGARGIPLDAELKEVAGMIQSELDSARFEDQAIQSYMEQGRMLVREVLEQQK